MLGKKNISFPGVLRKSSQLWPRRDGRQGPVVVQQERDPCPGIFGLAQELVQLEEDLIFNSKFRFFIRFSMLQLRLPFCS